MINQQLRQTMAEADRIAFSDFAGEGANEFVRQTPLRVQKEKIKGRGAALNPPGRFENYVQSQFDDGWDYDEPLEPLQTTVEVEKAHSIITHNTSPDIVFDCSINPYRGCEHGCVYCYARPTHAYMGLSSGIDFETRLFVKPDAAKILEREISKPNYKPKTIFIGTNTDPYQPIEKKWQIMRQIVEVLDRANHPLCIVTKSALVVRDIDILARMAEKKLIRVALSVTTLDRRLARSLEPRASTAKRRLWAVKQLSRMGIPVSVIVAPIIPGLNDHELEAILKEAKSAGAVNASYTILRLPYEVAPLFKDWLLREYPDRYRRVMQLLRDMRGGKDYDANWRSRMCGEGVYAKLISNRFRIAKQQLGLNRHTMKLSTAEFVPPLACAKQLSFSFE